MKWYAHQCAGQPPMIPMHVLRNSGMVFRSWRDGGVENLGGYQCEQVARPRMEEYRLCRVPGPSPIEGTSYIWANPG